MPRRLRALPLLLVVSTAISVQAESWLELLRRAQKKVGESLDSVPRYMCTETIDRSQYEPGSPGYKGDCDNPKRPAPRLSSTDRLRLDVAMAANREMYSWVGESKFNDGDLFDIVREGAMSTGSFAAFLSAIFRDEYVNFTYDGDTTLNGRSLSEFGFQVPYERSHYSYGQGAHQVMTGYSGSFLVDPKTANLVRLEVRTSKLPSETGACYASTKLDYSEVRMKGIDFLLPAASELTIDNTDGAKAVNRMVFSSCHEFLGESTISFGQVSSSAGRSAAHLAPPRFPAKLSFKIAIAQDFDMTAAAAGDPVKAKLMTPIKEGRKEFAPPGAPVGARIVRIRNYYDQSVIVLELKLETVSINGGSVPLVAEPDPGEAFAKGDKLVRRVPLGTLRGLEDRAASFEFHGKDLVFLKTEGIESEWRTTTP